MGQDGQEGLHAPAGALQFLKPGHVRHIARGPQDAHRATAGIAQQRLADVAAHQRAVLPLQARLAGPLAVGAHLAQRGEIMAAGHVLARIQQRDRPAHGLLRAVAEQRGRAAVPDADLAIEAEFAHRLLVQRIEQLLVARLHLPGALLGGIADGDIAVDHREAVLAPIGIGHRLDDHAGIERGAVAAHAPAAFLGPAQRAGGVQQARGLAGLHRFGGMKAGELAAGHLFCGVEQGTFGGIAPCTDAPLGSEIEDGDVIQRGEPGTRARGLGCRATHGPRSGKAPLPDGCEIRRLPIRHRNSLSDGVVVIILGSQAEQAEGQGCAGAGNWRFHHRRCARPRHGRAPTGTFTFIFIFAGNPCKTAVGGEPGGGEPGGGDRGLSAMAISSSRPAARPIRCCAASQTAARDACQAGCARVDPLFPCCGRDTGRAGGLAGARDHAEYGSTCWGPRRRRKWVEHPRVGHPRVDTHDKAAVSIPACFFSLSGAK
ncbi:hypothetical protein D3C72_839750 [compost metagenome]